MQIWVAFKLVHILAVIAAVGANLTYQFWYNRAGKDPAQLVWVIDNVRALDRRVANPAYIVAALAGAGIILSGGGFSFESLWVSLSVVLYIAVAIMGGAMYAPAMRRQRELALNAPASTEYAAAAKRSRMLGGIASAAVVVIICLMVIKPTI